MHASCCFDGIGGDTIEVILNANVSGDHSKIGKSDMASFDAGWSEFCRLYDDIKKYIKISGIETSKTNILANVNAVFTGFRSTELEKLIKENGGKVSNSVSAKTSHLVMAQVGSGTKKEQDAERLGKVIMDEQGFTDYINSRLNG